MTTAQHVLQKTLALPEDQQRRVLAFVESLAPPAAVAPLVDPYGLLADLPSDLDLNDFLQARAEMWANFPRELPRETS
jgi:hypothetical protein